MPKLKNPKTGHVALAVTPKEIVQLKAAGYVEQKPVKKAEPAKQQDTKG